LRSGVVGTARREGFYGFEDEYYLVIKAVSLGDIVTIPLACNPNLFDPIDEEKEKGWAIEKQIKQPIRKLAKTDIRRALHSSLNHKSVLERYYPSNHVEEVRGYILEALHE